MTSLPISRRNMVKLALGAGAISLPFASTGQKAAAQTLTATRTQGTIATYHLGAIKLHTYVAPELSAMVTSQIVETENSLHIIDAQFAPNFAIEMRDFAESLGKPIAAVYLSHAHPDHILGASALSDLPFVTSTEVLADAQESLPIYEQQKARFGDSSPIVLPEATLAPGSTNWDGVAVEIALVKNAETTNALTFHIPEAGVFIAQDLLYSNAHAFPLHNKDGWITALEEIRKLEGTRVIGAGHGLPANVGAIEDAIAYLNFQDQVISAAQDPKSAIEAITAQYPTYGAAGLLEFVGYRFQ